jgi:hypothetical protein
VLPDPPVASPVLPPSVPPDADAEPPDADAELPPDADADADAEPDEALSSGSTSSPQAGGPARTEAKRKRDGVRARWFIEPDV